MRRQRYSQLADRLKPYLNQTSTVVINNGGAGGGSGPHAHTFEDLEGELLTTQAPWVVTALNLLKPHGIADPVYHSATGPAKSVIGLTADDTIGLLSSTADGLTNLDTLLRSGPAGELTIGQLNAAPSLDTIHTLGYMQIGAMPGTGLAALKHNLSPRSALWQSQDGVTRLDAGEGMRLEFAVNDAVHAYVSQGQLRFMPSTRMQTDNYASQLAGWRLTYSGEFDARYIFANEMRIIKFIADMEQALAGSQIISKSVTTLAQNFTAPRPGLSSNLVVDDLPSGENIQVFEDGDFVLVHETTREAGGFSSLRCWGTVDMYEDLPEKKQQWRFTRIGTYSTDTPNPAEGSKWGIPSTTNSLTLPGPAIGSSDIHAKAGNLMLAVVLVESTTVTSTAPTGWTLHNTATVTGLRFSLYSKVRTGSEPGNYVWFHSSSVDSMGWIVTYQGQDPVTPIMSVIHTHESATQFPIIKHIAPINDLDVVLGFVAARADRSPVTPPAGWDMEYTSSAGGNTLAVFSTIASAEVGDVTAQLFGGTARCVTITVNMTAAPAPLDLSSGYMPVDNVVEAGAIILDYGVSGNGWHEVSAIDGYYGSNAPYSRVVSWTGHPALGAVVRTQSGNLNGIFGEGKEWGFFAGNGVSPTVNQFLRLSDRGAKFNNLAVEMYSGGIQRVNISADGQDVWIGTLSDKRLSWNGFTLGIKGAVTIDQASGFSNTGYLQIGTGVKDSSLSGFHLGPVEIVGQLAGVDQVVMGLDGRVYAGAGNVWMDASGINTLQQVTETRTSHYIERGYTFRRSDTFGIIGRLAGVYLSGIDQYGIDLYALSPNSQKSKAVLGAQAADLIYSPGSPGAPRVEAYSDPATLDYLRLYSAGKIQLFQSGSATPDIEISGGITRINNTLGQWFNLPYASGWADFGSGYMPGQYKIVGDLVFVRGLVKRVSGAGTLIATLPSGYRPGAGVLVGKLTDTGIGRVDINTAGQITLVSGGNGWVQLDDTILSIG